MLDGGYVSLGGACGNCGVAGTERVVNQRVQRFKVYMWVCFCGGMRCNMFPVIVMGKEKEHCLKITYEPCCDWVILLLLWRVYALLLFYYYWFGGN